MLTAKHRVFLMIALSALILWARVIPHQAHAMPVLGLFILLGLSSRSKLWMGSLMGLSAYMITDLYFGLYPGWIFNYLAFIALLFVGQKHSFKITSALKSGIIASLVFFAISNLGVFFYSGLYTKSLSGFYQCYLMAIPFFKMTLVSNVLFLLAVSTAVQGFLYSQKKTADGPLRY